ncbi:MAG TPA: glycoside hydrolase family 13 protein, partial [Chloroflexota bacterium]|nr:glycoside hydrolase family 13 protein [Chloroflexota bacterium]
MTGSSPLWVADAVFYQIFPDRFAHSSAVVKPANLEPWESEPTPNGFKGGDLLGVVEHLDYLRDLGITAIYLNPIFRSTANHRYHTTDYFEVDPILGGNDALDALLRAAHRRGIRVVLDGVFNHVGRGFYEFSHLLENGAQSPYLDWFRVRSWPLHAFGPADEDPGYECWWDKRELPKLMTHTPAVRSMLWSVAEHWIRRGIDGWRLDVPNEIDDDGFWREFRARVKHLNPDAFIVGEIWDDAGRWLAGDQFDGVQNYLFTKACLGFFCAGTSQMDATTFEGTGLDPVESLDAAGFRSTVDGLISRYSWTA